MVRAADAAAEVAGGAAVVEVAERGAVVGTVQVEDVEGLDGDVLFFGRDALTFLVRLQPR